MRTMTLRGLARGLLVAVALLACGCAGTPIGRADLIGFVKDGRTTREEVLLALGDPSGTYEGERIVTYRLARDAGGLYLQLPRQGWYGEVVNLVLVFDERGVLARHSLVEIRRPL